MPSKIKYNNFLNEQKLPPNFWTKQVSTKFIDYIIEETKKHVERKTKDFPDIKDGKKFVGTMKHPKTKRKNFTFGARFRVSLYDPTTKKWDFYLRPPFSSTL